MWLALFQWDIQAEIKLNDLTGKIRFLVSVPIIFKLTGLLNTLSSVFYRMTENGHKKCHYNNMTFHRCLIITVGLGVLFSLNGNFGELMRSIINLNAVWCNWISEIYIIKLFQNFLEVATTLWIPIKQYLWGSRGDWKCDWNFLINLKLLPWKHTFLL